MALGPVAEQLTCVAPLVHVQLNELTPLTALAVPTVQSPDVGAVVYVPLLAEPHAASRTHDPPLLWYPLSHVYSHLAVLQLFTTDRAALDVSPVSSFVQSVALVGVVPLHAYGTQTPPLR